MADAKPVELHRENAKERAKREAADINAFEARKAAAAPPVVDDGEPFEGKTFVPERGKTGRYARLLVDGGQGPLVKIVTH